MLKKLLAVSMILSFSAAMAVAADTATTSSKLTAAEIASKNIAARGGLQAWKAVQSMTWQGTLGAGGNHRATVSEPLPNKKAVDLPTDPRPAQEVMLPFVMDMERPHKMRFELQFRGQTALQIFDGTNGWKLRPYLNRTEVENYSADELKIASMKSELDGPLVDYAAKGTQIELETMEKVEDRDTYKLKLTMKSGQAIHLWIDARTFLDAKIEGQPRRLDGIQHPVEIYMRDYRAVDGLQIPFVLETKVLPVVNRASKVRQDTIPVETIVIEKVVVNPKLTDSLFAKPVVQVAANSHPAAIVAKPKN